MSTANNGIQRGGLIPLDPRGELFIYNKAGGTVIGGTASTQIPVPAAASYLELNGQYIDFHTGLATVAGLDYDARIIVSGANAVAGGSNMLIDCQNLTLDCNVASTSVNAGAAPFVVYSDDSIKFSGPLVNQDISVAVNTVLNSVPYLQHINVTGNAQITLPDLKSDGTFGIPSGVRMTVFVSTNDNLTFKTSVASGATIRVLSTFTSAIDTTNCVPALVLNDTATDIFPQNSFAYVTSTDDFWLINVIGTAIAIP